MSDTSPTPEGAFLPEGQKLKGDRGPRPEEPATAVPSVEKQRPPTLLRGQVVTILVAAVVAVVVAVTISASINLLWMASSGGRDDRLRQEGKTKVGPDGEREVFYAVPYAGPPNLEIESANLNFIKLKEQKADHFTIQSVVPSEVRWRAEGIRAVK